MSLLGANLEDARLHNRRVVLEAVRMHGPLSRAEIARLTSLSTQTVSNIAQELQEVGLLRAETRRAPTRGQPATPLSINPDGAYSIGFQLDHHNLIGVLINLAGDVCADVEIGVSSPGPGEGVPAMQRATEALLEFSGVPAARVCGVGVVMPGPFNVEGLTSVGPTTLPGWEAFPLAERLGAAVGLPVVVENDATAAAIGEHFFGAARHVRDFVYVFVGTGLGGGLFLAGQLYKGAFANAGELGHLVIDPGGRECHCGNRGV